MKEIIIVTPADMDCNGVISYEMAMKLFAHEIWKQPKGQKTYEMVIPFTLSIHMMKLIHDAYLTAGWHKVKIQESNHEKFPGTYMKLENTTSKNFDI